MTNLHPYCDVSFISNEEIWYGGTTVEYVRIKSSLLFYAFIVALFNSLPHLEPHLEDSVHGEWPTQHLGCHE